VQQTLQQLLGDSAQPLTQQEILERWPSGRPPAANSLWRSLTRACESGQLTRSGAGRKSEPFRYEAKSSRSLRRTFVQGALTYPLIGTAWGTR